MGKQLTACLWFEKDAAEAVKFYTTVFEDSEILNTTYHPENSTHEAGTLLTVEFRIGETNFVALNGGPMFKFTEAISYQIFCESQDEVDYYWNTLTANGGEESQCGWLKDKYGLSWQVIPTRLMELLFDPDKERAGRATQAMLEMQKIDIAKLEAAADAA